MSTLNGKSILAVALHLFAPTLLAVPTVSDVLVRQQWPWRNTIRVDFMLDGIGMSDVKFTFAAHDGETSLGVIPDAAIVGDRFADQNGLKTVTIDPTYAPALRSLGKTERFRLDVTCAEIGGRVLYKVIDLAKTRGEAGQVRYITEAELKDTASSWGEYEVNPVPGVNSVIWTAPAATDSDYQKRFLVMRRIRPGSFGFGATAAPVTLTKGFWMGVFETTGAQYTRFAKPTVTVGDCQPQRNVSQDGLRGEACVWPADGHTVAAESFFGRLATQVGENGFDLPTEAQWEYACRAGTTDNVGYRSDKTLAECAVYKDGTVTQCQAVGTRAPNAWGLFDMIGNAWEHTLVWNSSAADPGDGYDPVGPAVAPDANNHVVRGGAYASGASNCSCVSRTADENTTPTGTSGFHGFRIVQNGLW